MPFTIKLNETINEKNKHFIILDYKFLDDLDLVKNLKVMKYLDKYSHAVFNHLHMEHFREDLLEINKSFNIENLKDILNASVKCELNKTYIFFYGD